MATIGGLVAEVRTNKDLRREAYSMSLYVSIVLFSALWIFDDDNPPAQGEVFLLELGTTVGLVLAHGFASWLSTRIIGDHEKPGAWDLLRVQLGGALAVGSLAMLAVVLAPTSVELMAARLTVAATIAAQVFLESRTSVSKARAAVYGLRRPRCRRQRRPAQVLARALNLLAGGRRGLPSAAWTCSAPWSSWSPRSDRA